LLPTTRPRQILLKFVNKSKFRQTFVKQHPVHVSIFVSGTLFVLKTYMSPEVSMPESELMQDDKKITT
jgi:hypothetical protein